MSKNDKTTQQNAEHTTSLLAQYSLEKKENDNDRSMVTSRTILKFYKNGKVGIGILDNGFETLAELDYAANGSSLTAESNAGTFYPLTPNSYGQQVIAFLSLLNSSMPSNLFLAGLKIGFENDRLTVTGDIYGSEEDAKAGVNKTETKTFGTFEVTPDDAKKLGIALSGQSTKGSKFKKWFSSLAYKSKKNPNIDVKVEKVSFIKSLSVFKGVKLPWVWLIINLVLSVVKAVLSFYLVKFSASVIDAVGGVDTEFLTTYILEGIASAVCLVGAAFASSWAGNKINRDMRTKMWKKVLKMRKCDMGADGGEIYVSRVTTDAEYASKYFGAIISLVTLLVQLGVYVGMMYQLNVYMSNFIMIFVPVSVGLGYLISWLKYRALMKRQGFFAMSTAYLVERTKDLMLIKSCNTQQKEVDTGNDYFDRQYINQLQISSIQFFQDMVGKIIDLLSTVLPFVLGAFLIAQNKITIGEVAAFKTISGEVKNQLTNLITNYTALKEANGGIAKFAKIFDMPDEELDVGNDAPDTVEALAFENVSFSYVEGKQILNNVSFNIPKNKVTAILGKNGSGKTTSFNLIERLYEIDRYRDAEVYDKSVPEEDRKKVECAIRCGDVNIADYSLSSWRDKICIVQQGGSLMSGTLRSNICYGRDDVTEEEFADAVQKAHVADFAEELPLKYDSPVATDGNNFSGGQRQCIALARAMLSKKPYLLLDEATCNLDAKREHDVMDALGNLVKDRTTIIIAHSLGTIKHADHVVVLNKGEVESTGTPADILKQTDNYLSKMMKRATA